MIGVEVPDEMEQRIEQEVSEGMFKNRSELVRAALRRFFREKDISYRERLRLEAISRDDVVELEDLRQDVRERLLEE